jgi:CRISPR/Cas system-associated exonuclease Cas4 (RecB family)
MTQLDVLYRYGAPPTERAMLAMSKVRDVYGVRRLVFDEKLKTVRVEYDASRLTGAVIHQLLRRSGLDIVETVSLIAKPEDTAPPAPVQPSVA